MSWLLGNLAGYQILPLEIDLPEKIRFVNSNESIINRKSNNMNIME